MFLFKPFSLLLIFLSLVACSSPSESPVKKITDLLGPTPEPIVSRPNFNSYSNIFVYDPVQPSIWKGSYCRTVFYVTGGLVAKETNMASPTGHSTVLMYRYTNTGAYCAIRAGNGKDVIADSVDASSFTNGWYIGWFKSRNINSVKIEITTIYSWVKLNLTSSYGFVADGNWHKVKIPISAWTTLTNKPKYDLAYLNGFCELNMGSPSKGGALFIDGLRFARTTNE